ncbi:MAG: LptE family protein, partial [Balneolaceae bacterium]|nr:LptE family protein [Balneolaceae bacterium]
MAWNNREKWIRPIVGRESTRMSLRMRAAAALMALACVLSVTGCFRYGFTGTSIPEGVGTIYIPFFADQSTSGIGDLSDQLNQVLVNRFVNQTRLRIEPSEPDADVLLQGTIQRYTNEPTAVSGGEVAQQNRVTITVAVTYIDQ